MTLKLVTGRSSVKFHHKDDAMTVAWDLDASLEGDELLEALRRIVSFMDAQTGKEPLPERTPGLALEMAQMTHPAPDDPDAPVPYMPTNGWAAMPPIPPRLEGEVEFIPPEEQG
jgi:hypothetical protein